MVKHARLKAAVVFYLWVVSVACSIAAIFGWSIPLVRSGGSDEAVLLGFTSTAVLALAVWVALGKTADAAEHLLDLCGSDSTDR